MKYILMMVLLTLPVIGLGVTLQDMFLFHRMSPTGTTLYTDCAYDDAKGLCAHGLGTEVRLHRIVPKSRLTKTNTCLNDPYNLNMMFVPLHNVLENMVIGVVNDAYSQPYGHKSVKISTTTNRFEPPQHTKGAVGRQWLRMYSLKCVDLLDEDVALFTNWATLPVHGHEFNMMKFVMLTGGTLNNRIYKNIRSTYGVWCIRRNDDKKCHTPVLQMCTEIRTINCYLES